MITEEKQKEMIQKMREILQDDYLEWEIERYTLEEDLSDEVCRIYCNVVDQTGGEFSVEGEGVGTIDALFDALQNEFAEDYPSLKSVRFSKFDIRGLFSSKDKREMTTEAEAEATVGLLNSEGKEFIFKRKGPSVSRAGIEATIEAAEYFVNSERTYVKLHDIIEHYDEEGRTDLVEKYTEVMSQVVETTSYSEVLEEIKE